MTTHPATGVDQGAPGVVSGLDVSTSDGAAVTVGAGLACDALGRELRLAEPVTAAVPPGPLHRVVIAADDGPAAVRVEPLTLRRPLPTSASVPLGEVHLRSRVASAYFGDEWDSAGRPLSEGLRSGVWRAGPPAPAAEPVPLAVLGWTGAALAFLDTWTARRERTGGAYWPGRLEIRPWPVFLAQVLQFQDQVAGAAAGSLLDAGFVDLPPAGYLTVDPDAPLHDQLDVRFGAGVDLRLCAARRDQLGRELSRMRDMRRISLVQGLDDPAARQQVDVLVPNGIVGTTLTGIEVRAWTDWVLFRRRCWRLDER
jgi:hypothetical protein